LESGVVAACERNPNETGRLLGRKEVEKGLELRLSGVVQTFQKVGGVEAVAAMLNLADRATEKGILEGLEVEDPDLVEQIRRLMFVFEDILLVNDKGIQAVLKEELKCLILMVTNYGVMNMHHLNIITIMILKFYQMEIF